ncbi:ABC transporter permease [Granulicella sibirica]|uniref:ABC transporter, permease protein n=1 Tax=Granulicella sibirica TaxID=2479048 RepID=A0A4Q0T501_9BACT|nr:ABC transporter permease [Granulicella sibirica]RXH58773.1 ABC transporter, permease protein [Granulicella sibirica]
MSTALTRFRAKAKSWLRAVTSPHRLDTDMEAELNFHLEARAADLIRERGLTEREAHRQARLEFGGIATHKDDMRRSLGLRWGDELLADVVYGARILRKSPGFTAIAVGSLALAIGANTTIFSLANELLYARLGVPHPEELRVLAAAGDKNVSIHSSWGSNYFIPNGEMRFDEFTYPVYQQLKQENKVLGEIFAYKESIRANVTVDGAAQAVQLEMVSGNLYEQMGVHPILGREIVNTDDAVPGSGAVAIISYGFWQRALAGRPDAVGKVIAVNTTPVTVIGVNPRSFTGARDAQSSPEIFMPLSTIPVVKGTLGSHDSLLESKDLWWVQLMARSKPGVSIEQARAALDVNFHAAVRATDPPKKNDTMPHILVEDGSRGLNVAGRQYAQPMYVLLGFVGLVLLLACANIANLMLARASVRQREMGVRLALGANRSRILRQVLTESLMLALMGGAVGLLLSWFSRTALPRLLASAWEPNAVQVPFDGRVFAFTATVTLLTGILFGIGPAWGSTRAEIGTALKEGGKSATRRRKGLSGSAIVAFQVALSTLLVAGAGLFLRTLINLNAVDPGFRTDHLVLMDINPPEKQYKAPKDVALHERLEDTLRTVPGVEGVTLSDIPFIANSRANSTFFVEGTPKAAHQRGEDTNSLLATVGPDFLSVMGIPLVSGRSFTAQDNETSPRVALVNQALVKKFFPNQDPIGKRFYIDDRDPKERLWLTIIGICADTHYAELKGDPPPIHFDLYRQNKEVGGVTYMIRTPMKPEAIVQSVRAAVQRIDPNLPLIDVRTQKQQIDATMQQERMFATLTSGFGVLALALACVGIYGIMAYTVSQRTNEIGIRLALGARRSQVRVMVLREAGWLSLFGIVAGLAVALALGKLVKSMLYGLQPNDPFSLTASALLLLAVALVAGLVPAIRASRVEPMQALRHE